MGGDGEGVTIGGVGGGGAVGGRGRGGRSSRDGLEEYDFSHSTEDNYASSSPQEGRFAER